MQIEKLKQAIELLKLMDDCQLETPKSESKSEFAIVVADRGFVYIGDVTETKEHCFIENGYSIRQWGTTKGLGELVLEGAKSGTKIDACGSLRIPIKAVISIHQTKRSLWKLS